MKLVLQRIQLQLLEIKIIGIIIKEFNAPILVGLVQTFIVSICSLIPALIFEEFIWSNILSQKIQIIYYLRNEKKHN